MSSRILPHVINCILLAGVQPVNYTNPFFDHLPNPNPVGLMSDRTEMKLMSSKMGCISNNSKLSSMSKMRNRI